MINMQESRLKEKLQDYAAGIVLWQWSLRNEKITSFKLSFNSRFLHQRPSDAINYHIDWKCIRNQSAMNKKCTILSFFFKKKKLLQNGMDRKKLEKKEFNLKFELWRVD